MSCRAKVRSLKLLFLDGGPDGIQMAEMSNWNGHILLVPRIRFRDARGRKEINHSGVYLLLGVDNEDNLRLYIGQSVNMAGRTPDHIEKKDWWTIAVYITTTDQRLSTAHARYLERGLYKIAKSAGLAVLDNGNEPGGEPLDEADCHEMGEFLDRLMSALPAMGVHCFLERSRTQVNLERAESKNLPVFVLRNDDLGVDATAVFEDNEMVVQKDSSARKKWASKASVVGYGKLTEELKQTGFLREEQDCSVFVHNCAFPSPSAAAAVVLGTPATGYNEWTLKETGKTFGEWIKRQNLEEDD